MKVQRIECKECGRIRQERIRFVTGKRSYTNKFARYVVSLSRIGTIKDVAMLLNVSWDTVKDIQKRYLQRHYGNPDLCEPEYIGIDEFAVRKGHVYKTIVVDLLTGQVAYVGDGKGADALEKFWKKIRKAKVRIKAVATDLSAAFISSVRVNAPEATLVFDHFCNEKGELLNFMITPGDIDDRKPLEYSKFVELTLKLIYVFGSHCLCLNQRYV